MDGLVLKTPSNFEMDTTVQEYTRDGSKMLGMQIAGGIKETAAQRVEWDLLDNEKGKTAYHTMGTDPKQSTRPGSKLYSYEPIPHKEAELVKEPELLKSRAYGTINGVVNIEDLILERLQAGLTKDDIAMEVEIWSALQGALNINENGVIVNETFPIQQYNPAVAWDQLATAKPLADMDAVNELFAGTGASGEGAIAYASSVTLNKIYANTNQADLAGQTVDNLRPATYSLQQLNKILTDRTRPTFAEQNEGYFNDALSWTKFIPTGKVIVVGKRPTGQRVIDYLSTASLHRTKNGTPAGGRFGFVTVNGQPNASGMMGISLEQLGQNGNPKVEVIHGVYGGPRIRYPRSVILINAF